MLHITIITAKITCMVIIPVAIVIRIHRRYHETKLTEVKIYFANQWQLILCTFHNAQANTIVKTFHNFLISNLNYV